MKAARSPGRAGGIYAVVERGAMHIVDAMKRWLVCAVILGATTGASLWALFNLEHYTALMNNALSPASRTEALVSAGIGAMLAPSMVVGAWLVLRRSSAELRLRKVGTSSLFYGHVLFALPLVLMLSAPGVEVKHPTLVLIIALVLALGAIHFVYRICAQLRPKPKADAGAAQPRWLELLPLALLCLSMLTYAGIASYLSIVIHRGFDTHFDLAVYDNLLWQSAHGRPLACSFCIGESHLGDHFDPVLVLLSPLYLLHQSAENLLVLQSVWLASGALPLLLICRHKLNSDWAGLVLGVSYLLYPALHGANLFAFHSLALAGPLLIWIVYLLDKGSRLYWLAAVLLLLTREDMSLLALFIGAYALVLGRFKTGAVTIVVSCTYLLSVKLYLMADPGLLMSGGDHSTSFSDYYEQLIPYPEEGARGLVFSLLSNPAYAGSVLLEKQKLVYYLCLLVPLLFFPLLARKKLLLMCYGVLFLGLSSRAAVASLHFQYSTVLFPFLFAAAPDGVRRIAHTAVKVRPPPVASALLPALMSGILISSLIVALKFGGFATNSAFRAGFTRPRWHLDEQEHRFYAGVSALIQTIPKGASVAATRNLAAHVSNRRHAIEWFSIVRHLLPHTHKNVPSLDPSFAEYLLIDRRANIQGGPEALERLKKQKRYRLAAGFGSVRLYRRVD